MICLMGGIIGILLGAGVSYIASLVAAGLGYEWSFIISPASVTIAFIFSVAIGVIFGTYPALKASRLDPISALRYE